MRPDTFQPFQRVTSDRPARGRLVLDPVKMASCQMNVDIENGLRNWATWPIGLWVS